MIINFSLLTLLTSFICSASETFTYVRADYGLGKFTSDKYDKLNAKPDGSTIGFSLGSKMSYVELGLFYRQSNLESDINHDGLANKISHKGTSYGVDMNVFLNNHLSLKFGYSFNSYKEKLGTSVSTQTLTAIKNVYGLQESYTSSNVFYGANLDIFGAKKFDFYTSVLHFPMGDGKSSTTAQFGIRLYMDLTIADFFGAG